MKVAIERVDERNFDLLANLIEQLALFEQLSPPDAEAKGRLRKDVLTPAPRFEAHLAMHDGRPVGFLTLLNTYSTFAARPVLYLEDLFVLADYRRLGIGQQLFDFCVSLARTRGCVRLEWNVLKWNKSAMQFYDKNGAIQVNEWVWYRLATR